MGKKKWESRRKKLKKRWNPILHRFAHSLRKNGSEYKACPVCQQEGFAKTADVHEHICLSKGMGHRKFRGSVASILRDAEEGQQLKAFAHSLRENGSEYKACPVCHQEGFANTADVHEHICLSNGKAHKKFRDCLASAPQPRKNINQSNSSSSSSPAMVASATAGTTGSMGSSSAVGELLLSRIAEEARLPQKPRILQPRSHAEEEQKRKETLMAFTHSLRENDSEYKVCPVCQQEGFADAVDVMEHICSITGKGHTDFRNSVASTLQSLKRKVRSHSSSSSSRSMVALAIAGTTGSRGSSSAVGERPICRVAEETRLPQEVNILQPRSHAEEEQQLEEALAASIACSSEPTHIGNAAGACVICMERDASHLVVACGHQCICLQCSSSPRVRVCPMCRGPVNQFLQVFASGIQKHFENKEQKKEETEKTMKKRKKKRKTSNICEPQVQRPSHCTEEALNTTSHRASQIESATTPDWPHSAEAFSIDQYVTVNGLLADAYPAGCAVCQNQFQEVLWSQQKRVFSVKCRGSKRHTFDFYNSSWMPQTKRQCLIREAKSLVNMTMA